MPVGNESLLSMLPLEEFEEHVWAPAVQFEQEVLSPAAIAAEAEVVEAMGKRRWTGWHVAGAFGLGLLALKAFGRRG